MRFLSGQLKAYGGRFLCAPGNHDPAEFPGAWRPGVRTLELDGFRIAAVDDSRRTVSTEDLNALRALCAEGVPMIVLCHVPMATPYCRDALRQMMESFYKEIGVLYKLNQSGNFVKIYDYFNANNTCYYVMEYVEGDTLKERVRKRGVLDPRQWEKPFLQLMRDLSFLHAHDVIHRDIAPDNVKVLEDGTLKLIDFGLARPYMMDAQVTINLKPGFAPCEQYSSHGQGAYTDVYALAATMYYCFTGSVIPDAYERKVKDTIIAPRSLCPKLTARQERALLRALAVDYRQRIQNMQEFEKAYSSDVPVADPPPVGDPPAESGSRLKESLRVLREQPLLPAAAGLLFLIAAALQIAL